MKSILPLIILFLLAMSCTVEQNSKVQDKKTKEVEQVENVEKIEDVEIIKTEEKNGKYKTAFIEVKDSTFIFPHYINTNINCVKRAPFSEVEKLAPQISTSYFSEYSSIYFVTVVTPKQIIFHTFNENGTIKPDLIFYLMDIELSVYKQLLNYFKYNKTIKDLTYTHKSAQHLNLKDKAKNTVGNKWEGDKFPLTKKESSWLVKRQLNIFSQIGHIDIKYDEGLLRPVFYNMCNYEKEFNNWKEIYPEIQDHELNY